jgi:hypothetical protein
MLINGKCDGERPACKGCVDRNQMCEYTCEPGITPVASLKRKYESLQAESTDEHDLLDILRTASDADAMKVLARLRSSNNIQATLYQARNIGVGSSDLAVQATPASPLRQSTLEATGQSSLQATRASVDGPSIYPELNDSDGGTPWALPMEPYVCDAYHSSRRCGAW